MTGSANTRASWHSNLKCTRSTNWSEPCNQWPGNWEPLEARNGGFRKQDIRKNKGGPWTTRMLIIKIGWMMLNVNEHFGCGWLVIAILLSSFSTFHPNSRVVWKDHPAWPAKPSKAIGFSHPPGGTHPGRHRCGERLKDHGTTRGTHLGHIAAERSEALSCGCSRLNDSVSPKAFASCFLQLTWIVAKDT